MGVGHWCKDGIRVSRIPIPVLYPTAYTVPMAPTPPPPEQLGQFVIHAVAAGTSGLVLGRFAALQCAGDARQLDLEALGAAVAHLVQAGATAEAVGRFTWLCVASPGTSVHDATRTSEQTIGELVRQEVRAQLEPGTRRDKGKPVQRLGVPFKLTLQDGKLTSISIPKDLLADCRAALGQEAVRNLLKQRAGGTVPAGTTRSHLARVALEEALQIHRDSVAARTPLTLVPR